MKRVDAIRSIYADLEIEGRVVVTIMGAVAAELQGLGHRPNFFYLQHAMGIASSLGLGIALCRPERVAKSSCELVRRPRHGGSRDPRRFRHPGQVTSG